MTSCNQLKIFFFLLLFHLIFEYFVRERFEFFIFFFPLIFYYWFHALKYIITNFRMLYYFELYMYHNYCYRRKRHSYAACYIAFGAIIIMLAYSHLWSNRKQGLVTKLLEFYIPDCAPCFVFIKFLLEIYSYTFCNYHFFFLQHIQNKTENWWINWSNASGSWIVRTFVFLPSTYLKISVKWQDLDRMVLWKKSVWWRLWERFRVHVRKLSSI